MKTTVTVANAQAAIEVHGGALYLFSTSHRNQIIRTAAMEAGEEWQAKFLPLRFTKYVTRFPFSGARTDLGFVITKVRKSKLPEVVKRWQAMLSFNFMGWDPWTNTNLMKPQLYRKWLHDHPGEYKVRPDNRTVMLKESARAYADLRKWAKKIARQFAILLDQQGFIQPLVDSGALRSGAFGGKIKATSTTFKFTLKVPIPFPGPRNPVVSQILQTVPPWELERVGTSMANTISSLINSSQDTFSRSMGGGVNRGLTLLGAQSRIPESATGRSVE